MPTEVRSILAVHYCEWVNEVCAMCWLVCVCCYIVGKDLGETDQARKRGICLIWDSVDQKLTHSTGVRSHCGECLCSSMLIVWCWASIIVIVLYEIKENNVFICELSVQAQEMRLMDIQVVYVTCFLLFWCPVVMSCDRCEDINSFQRFYVNAIENVLMNLFCAWSSVLGCNAEILPMFEKCRWLMWCGL